MNSPSRGRSLSVVLAGRTVAMVERRAAGTKADTVTLTYAPVVQHALAPSLPVQLAPHRGTPVLGFLAGLLPDDESVRRLWAARFGVSDHPIDLLTHMGRDCAGAVQFVAEGHEQELAVSARDYVPLTEEEIAERLRGLRTQESPSWTARDEHWSLGGAQAKFALALVEGRWCEATGAAPTTHIFKPGIARLKHQAAIEYATMSASRALGLRTARVDLALFEDEPALVVERFDRRAASPITSPADVSRIHQVDLCQAAGLMPEMKYETTPGAPTARALAQLLRRVSTRPEVDVTRFSDSLLFNYLAECPDGHAKNHALLMTSAQVRLAPLYDLATGAPYDRLDAASRAAFAVGGVRNFGEAHLKHWLAHAKEFALDPDERIERVRELAERIPDAFRDAFNDSRADMLEERLGKRLWKRMSSRPGKIVARCESVLKRLE